MIKYFNESQQQTIATINTSKPTAIIESRGKIFTCVKRTPNTREQLVTFWNTYVEPSYQLIGSLIYIPPTNYWTLYKKIKGGINFLSTNFKCDDGNSYTFPDTNFYFESAARPDYGVYGIYHNDELLYIGSTTNFEERFHQHQTSGKFTQDPSTLTFRSLISNEELLDSIIITKPLSIEAIESMELALILTLKPPMNKEGISSPFIFKTRTSENLVQDFLRYDINSDFLKEILTSSPSTHPCGFAGTAIIAQVDKTLTNERSE